MRRLLAALVVLALAGGLLPLSLAHAQTPNDFPIANGWFYSQANGQGGGGQTGYAVTDDNGVLFWTAFQSFGGVSAVGYPVSHRFQWNGFTVQAFQKVVFQWRPDMGNTVAFVNVLDELGLAGQNQWLLNNKQVPLPQDWASDAGMPWAQVVARHQALLDQNPAIRSLYFASPDPIAYYGLPMAVQDFGNVYVVRAQRVVFQQWKVAVPWAAAGQVVIANGGDLGKEANLYPGWAVQPLPPGATPSPNATATPGTCNGDESLSFNPPVPTPGQAFTIVATSGRASTNIGLNGPGNPQFGGATNGGKGTQWTWQATINDSGTYTYNFVVNGVTCATATVNVTNAPAPTATPGVAGCFGDEVMTITPPNATINDLVTITVTSARASTNIGLSGPFNPALKETKPGGKGTQWVWEIRPNQAGQQFQYRFTVDGYPCTTGFLNVRGNTMTPYPYSSPTGR